jgi:hypothetical protein
VIGPQSAPGWRVTVTKSFTPKTDATPPAAKTARAKALSSASSGPVTFMVSGSVVSRVNLTASGLGVGEGEAVAIPAPYGGTRIGHVASTVGAGGRTAPTRSGASASVWLDRHRHPDEGRGAPVATLTAVARVTFRARPTRLSRDELRSRLATELATAFSDPDHGVEVDVAAQDADPVLRWHDGPAASAVADAVGRVVNWEVRAASAPAARAGAPAVLLARTLSDRALAVAVVRWQASNVRPYTSTDERATAGLAELLDVDDPARPGYPVVEAMADLLLASPEPPELDTQLPRDATRADRLAVKLRLLGYDALWAVAWRQLR